jgi:hypothetical protein
VSESSCDVVLFNLNGRSRSINIIECLFCANGQFLTSKAEIMTSRTLPMEPQALATRPSVQVMTLSVG